ncbi:MAG: REP-associated tyrosine transposase [Planctomycetota bacterium]
MSHRTNPWHSRGYLPHFDQPGATQSITFRLADSVPSTLIRRWRSELKLDEAEAAAEPQRVELRRRIERFADRGFGECWLQVPSIAEIVENSLFHFDGERYALIAWCVMPNHVHVMVETRAQSSLREIMHSWKSFTSKACNRYLNRTGQFWAPDYFDRFIRDTRHLQAAIQYIHENPVKAGLVELPADWRFSRAYFTHADRNSETYPLRGLDCGSSASSP